MNSKHNKASLADIVFVRNDFQALRNLHFMLSVFVKKKYDVLFFFFYKLPSNDGVKVRQVCSDLCHN